VIAVVGAVAGSHRPPILTAASQGTDPAVATLSRTDMGRKDHSTGADALPADVRSALAGAIDRAGSVRAAARALGLPRQTVRRAQAGCSMRPGSHALIRAALGLPTTTPAPTGAKETTT
jgi:hypothetical protein